MVTSSLSARRGAGPGRFKACWITAAPFIVSSTMVKMVVRTVALSSIGSALLVCLCWLQTVAYYSSHSLSAISTKRNYLSFPIPDRSVPPFSASTFAFLEQVNVHLSAGKHVALHCRQGLGRAVLMAASLLLLTGFSPDQAFDRLSKPMVCYRLPRPHDH